MSLTAATRTPQRLAGTRSDDSWLALILGAGQAIESGLPDLAGRILRTVQTEARETGRPVERLARVFASALAAGLGGRDSYRGNLYLSAADELDMLDAFETLVHQTPLVRFGHRVTAAAISRAVFDARVVHLIDLGIGAGSQWPALFGMLATRPDGGPRLRVTGVDLPAPGQDPAGRLRQTGRLLHSAAARHGIRLDYVGKALPLEALKREDLEVADDEVVVVNAALALHHLHDGSVDPANPRDRVLCLVRAVEPRVFTLVEPEAEHNSLTFGPRLTEALVHYGAVFEALGASLDPDLRTRRVIEQAFFGREILNIFSARGGDRVERHERHEVWLRRLARAGFEAVDSRPLRSGVEQALALSAPFGIRPVHGALSLCFGGTPLVNASAWTPAI